MQMSHQTHFCYSLMKTLLLSKEEYFLGEKMNDGSFELFTLNC